MENEQLARAKKWKGIANVAWYVCMGLGILASLTWGWWAPEHPSAVALNVGCFLVGFVFFSVAFFEGRYRAVSARPISFDKYSEEKTFAVRVTIFSGVLFTVLGCVCIFAVLKNGETSAYSIPGLAFLFFSLIPSRHLVEIYFLKRLGKVVEGEGNRN